MNNERPVGLTLSQRAPKNTLNTNYIINSSETLNYRKPFISCFSSHSPASQLTPLNARHSSSFAYGKPKRVYASTCA